MKKNILPVRNHCVISKSPNGNFIGGTLKKDRTFIEKMKNTHFKKTDPIGTGIKINPDLITSLSALDLTRKPTSRNKTKFVNL